MKTAKASSRSRVEAMGSLDPLGQALGLLSKRLNRRFYSLMPRLSGGGGGGGGGGEGDQPLVVTVVSYNLFWWNAFGQNPW